MNAYLFYFKNERNKGIIPTQNTYTHTDALWSSTGVEASIKTRAIIISKIELNKKKKKSCSNPEITFFIYFGA